MDEGKLQVDNTGGSDGGLTEDAAIQAHNAYVQSVASALENTNIQQYVETNSNATNAFSGLKVYPGSNISSLGTGTQDASQEDK